MTRIVCPTCGTRIHAADPQFHPTPRQHRILEELPAIQRRGLKGTATTKQIAVAIGMNPDRESDLRLLRNDLQVLKQAGEISNPAGLRSGWAVKEIYGIALRKVS